MKRWIYGEVADMPGGPGFCAIEFDGEWASRQVDRYGELWFCSSDPKSTAEPAFSELELDEEIRFIPEEEFEQLWAAAMAACGGERPYT